MTSAFTLHEALLRSARRFPDRVAVEGADGTSLTYATLARRAGQVATVVREAGVGPGDRVAVAAEKSPTSVAALYGVMGAGAAYVPIDPLTPPRRAARILDDAGCAVLCTDGKWATEGLSTIPAVLLDDARLRAADADPMERGCEADLAYILYTSGSTGAPKGVMLTHRNALSFVTWAVDRFDITSADKLSSHAPFHFDLSVLDLYGAALAGAEVRLLSVGEGAFGASMASVVRDAAITVWYSVPSALMLLCDAARPDDLATLRTVLFAGEVFPMKHLRRLRALLPGAVLANLYGPTETNVCTYHVVPAELPADDTPLPIGRACENQEVFALDDGFRPVADGEVGELWVRGPTVMKGYWGGPERSARSLRQNPLHERFPDPAYNTGDLVRRLPTGDYEFLGRRDHQVKSRGYRIELGEIEAALVSHPDVREAAVAPVPDERLGHALVAFAAVDGVVDELDLKRHCAERVPRYMVPGSIVVTDSLPRTSTGKVDRQALAARATEP